MPSFIFGVGLPLSNAVGLTVRNKDKRMNRKQLIIRIAFEQTTGLTVLARIETKGVSKTEYFQDLFKRDSLLPVRRQGGSNLLVEGCHSKLPTGV